MRVLPKRLRLESRDFRCKVNCTSTICILSLTTKLCEIPQKRRQSHFYGYDAVKLKSSTVILFVGDLTVPYWIIPVNLSKVNNLCPSVTDQFLYWHCGRTVHWPRRDFIAPTPASASASAPAARPVSLGIALKTIPPRWTCDRRHTRWVKINDAHVVFAYFDDFYLNVVTALQRLAVVSLSSSIVCDECIVTKWLKLFSLKVTLCLVARWSSG